jgi:hypothetical protein
MLDIRCSIFDTGFKDSRIQGYRGRSMESCSGFSMLDAGYVIRYQPKSRTSLDYHSERSDESRKDGNKQTSWIPRKLGMTPMIFEMIYTL